jgi:tetratricopeptide (TPR) repeat protein
LRLRAEHKKPGAGGFTHQFGGLARRASMGDHLFQRCWSALLYDEPEFYDETIQSLTEHLAANPTNGAAYNNRGIAYWEIGEIDLALSDFDKAIELARSDALPAKHRGMLLQKMGELSRALADFDLAVSIAPDDAYTLRTRGHARHQAGEFLGAVQDFSRAIALQPEFAQQYLDRAAIYERLGQDALAKEDRATASGLA